MKRRPFSITVLVALSLLGLSLAEIGILSYLIFKDSSQMLSQQILKSYEASAAHGREKITNTFFLLESSVIELAENSLLVNGLIDELGREQYLPGIFQSFSVSGLENLVSVSLHDFQLEMIETNRRDFRAPGVELVNLPVVEKWVVEQGKIYRNFKVNENGESIFILGVPVFYENAGEGMVMATVNWSRVWSRLFAQWPDIAFSLQHLDVSVAATGPWDEPGMIKNIRVDSFPGLVISIKVPDSVVQDPIHAMEERVVLLGGMLLLMMLVLNTVFVARRISQPIIQLKDAVSHVADGRWSQVELRGSGREIQELAESFNRMSRQLEKTQTELKSSYQALEEERAKQLQHAYEAGIAEHAISVLHNIGNAVTPAVVSLKNLQGNQRQMTLIEYFQKLASTFEAHFQTGGLEYFLSNDEKGQQMLPFMKQLIEELKIHQFKEQDTFQIIDSQLEHISNTIALQQKYANPRPLEEPFFLPTLVADVLRMQEDALEKRKIQLTTTSENDLPKIHLDKNKLVQILLNLVKNSIESLDAQVSSDPEASRVIEVDVKELQDENIKIMIKDSGIGLEPSELARVFEFGYSSKKRGSGFGLHDCANFIRANGGEISINSPGLGQGATVNILLPSSSKVYPVEV